MVKMKRSKIWGGKNGPKRENKKKRGGRKRIENIPGGTVGVLHPIFFGGGVWKVVGKKF